MYHFDDMQIEKEIEAIFVLLENDSGFDVDGVLEIYERLKESVTTDELPTLVSAIQSPRNDFWSRELLGGLICDLGNSDHLDVLLNAARLNEEEGHDNDTLNFNLTELVEAQKESSRKKTGRTFE